MGLRIGLHGVTLSILVVRIRKANALPKRYNYETGAISPDVAEQAEQTFRNIRKALSAAGAGVDDIVRVRYILPDRDDFARCWPVLRKWCKFKPENDKRVRKDC